MTHRHRNAESAALINAIIHSRGWGRRLPPATIVLLEKIALGGAYNRDLLDRKLRGDEYSPEGLASSSWRPLHAWTDKELADLDAKFGVSNEKRLSASEVRAEEAAERDRDLRTMERYLSAKGLPAGHTIGALLELLIACEVVCVGAEGVLTLNLAAPTPADTLPLEVAEDIIRDRSQ